MKRIHAFTCAGCSRELLSFDKLTTCIRCEAGSQAAAMSVGDAVCVPLPNRDTVVRCSICGPELASACIVECPNDAAHRSFPRLAAVPDVPATWHRGFNEFSVHTPAVVSATDSTCLVIDGCTYWFAAGTPAEFIEKFTASVKTASGAAARADNRKPWKPLGAVKPGSAAHAKLHASVMERLSGNQVYVPASNEFRHAVADGDWGHAATVAKRKR